MAPAPNLDIPGFLQTCGECRIWTYDGTNVLLFSVNLKEVQSSTLPILLIDIYYGSKLWQPNTVLFLQLISVSAYTVRIIKRVVYLAKLFILTSINLRRVGDSNSHIVSEWLFSRQLLYLLSQPSNCCIIRIRTWTNRTKICGATITLWGNVLPARNKFLQLILHLLRWEKTRRHLNLTFFYCGVYGNRTHSSVSIHPPILMLIPLPLRITLPLTLCGVTEIRTLDLLNANQMLYQTELWPLQPVTRCALDYHLSPSYLQLIRLPFHI